MEQREAPGDRPWWRSLYGQPAWSERWGREWNQAPASVWWFLAIAIVAIDAMALFAPRFSVIGMSGAFLGVALGHAIRAHRRDRSRSKQP